MSEERGVVYDRYEYRKVFLNMLFNEKSVNYSRPPPLSINSDSHTPSLTRPPLFQRSSP